jgi:hypothetical protein
MEELRKFEGLSLEELEAQRVELLPDREEMQTFGDVTFGDQTVDATQTAVQVVALGDHSTVGAMTQTAVQVVAPIQAIVVPPA